MEHGIFELDFEWEDLAVWRWRGSQERLGEYSRLRDLVDQMVGQENMAHLKLLQFGWLLGSNGMHG